MSTEPAAGPSASQQLAAVHHNAASKRRYAKAVALILVAVLAGVIIGAAGAVVFLNKKMHRVPPRPDAIADAMINRVAQLVTITPEEDARLRVIAHEHMSEVDQIREQSFEDMHVVFRRMNEQVDSLLGPERAVVWKEYRDRRAKEKGYRGGGKGRKGEWMPGKKGGGRDNGH